MARDLDRGIMQGGSVVASVGEGALSLNGAFTYEYSSVMKTKRLWKLPTKAKAIERTHPHYSLSYYGGYTLLGYKLLTASSCSVYFRIRLEKNRSQVQCFEAKAKQPIFSFTLLHGCQISFELHSCHNYHQRLWPNEANIKEPSNHRKSAAIFSYLHPPRHDLSFFHLQHVVVERLIETLTIESTVVFNEIEIQLVESRNRTRWYSI